MRVLRVRGWFPVAAMSGLVGLVVLGAAGAALAQPADDGAAEPAEGTPAPAAPQPAAAPPTTTFDGGLPPPRRGKTMISGIVLEDTMPQPPPRFAWQLFGYLRLQYVASQNDPDVLFVGRDDGFELQNARVGIRGSLDQRVDFVLSIDGAVDERTQINVPEGKLRVGLRDAYADVKLGAKLVARAGFFQTIVDPQALVPDTAREFVDKPIESRGVRATEGYETQGLTPGRSLGAALRLDPDAPERGGPKLGFELAIQNGADEYASNNDNDKPAVSAGLLARFGKQSWLVAAGRYNPRSVGALPFRQDETDLQGSLGLRIAAGPVLVGGGALVQRTSFPTTGGPVQNAFGGHAELLIRTGIYFPVAFGYRFGILDPSSLLTTDRVMEHTVGAVLSVPSYHMRLQVQLTHVDDQRELSNSRAQLALELAL